MTDEERNDEGAEEEVEDLEAPAEAQEDVAGGACPANTCRYTTYCLEQTCKATKRACLPGTHDEILYNS
jgi:hypothetical protein